MHFSDCFQPKFTQENSRFCLMFFVVIARLREPHHSPASFRLSLHYIFFLCFFLLYQKVVVYSVRHVQKYFNSSDTKPFSKINTFLLCFFGPLIYSLYWNWIEHRGWIFAGVCFFFVCFYSFCFFFQFRFRCYFPAGSFASAETVWLDVLLRALYSEFHAFY